MKCSWATIALCLRKCAIYSNNTVLLIVTIFDHTHRYGQTGTGKTFTMEGERSPEGALSWEQVC